MYYDDSDYSAADAAFDDSVDKLEDAIASYLPQFVDPVIETVEGLLAAQESGERIDDTQPWTWERYMLWIYVKDGEDGLQEFLADHFREDAEAAIEDAYEPGPCCNQFSCPCGGSYSYR